jgi:hypothetical protein
MRSWRGFTGRLQGMWSPKPTGRGKEMEQFQANGNCKKEISLFIGAQYSYILLQVRKDDPFKGEFSI